MLVTCIGLIAHHLFAVLHGDRRLKARFGDAFDELKNSTSSVPFVAVIDGRQTLDWLEFVRPAQLGIAIAVGVFWWAHRFIPQAGALVRNSALESLFRCAAYTQLNWLEVDALGSGTRLAHPRIAPLWGCRDWTWADQL